VTRLAEVVGVVARHEVARVRTCELGVVKSVYPNSGSDHDHACAVELRDSGLLLPRVPVAVGITGAASLPAVDDLVAVLFVGGDLHAPLIVGRLYHDGLEPPEHTPDEAVVRLPPGESDATARLDVVLTAPDADGRKLEVTVDGDAKVTLTLTPGEVAVVAGDAELHVRQAGGSKGEVTLVVGNNTVSVDGGGDVKVEAEGTLTLKGKEVKIDGQTSVKVNGQTVEIN